MPRSWRRGDGIGPLARSLLRAATASTLRRAPLSLWRRLFPKSAVGVCYHVVSDAPLPHLKHYRRLAVAEFDADLDYLQRTFRVMGYDELERRRESRDAVRDNAAILTFDDGFAQCADIAAPLLRKRGLGGVFFVITNLIDNASMFRESAASLCIDAILKTRVEQVAEIVRQLGIELEPPREAPSETMRPALDRADFGERADARLRPLLRWLLTIESADAPLLTSLAARLGVDVEAYLREARPYMTASQIRKLHSDGFTIGAHSCSHRLLQKLSRDEAACEIVESCRIIRDLTGQRTVPFAFPYSGGGLNRSWLAELRRQNDFIGLFFDTEGLREDESFVVQRIFGERMGYDRTLDSILRRAWAKRNAWGRRA
jgi:peptidoglycan/xylan/chitin deacetylase (PgdA/CDA1 family)